MIRASRVDAALAVRAAGPHRLDAPRRARRGAAGLPADLRPGRAAAHRDSSPARSPGGSSGSSTTAPSGGVAPESSAASCSRSTASRPATRSTGSRSSSTRRRTRARCRWSRRSATRPSPCGSSGAICSRSTGSTRSSCDTLSADHPLFLLVQRPNRLSWKVFDGLWLRLVDVGAALSARSPTARRPHHVRRLGGPDLPRQRRHLDGDGRDGTALAATGRRAARRPGARLRVPRWLHVRGAGACGTRGGGRAGRHRAGRFALRRRSQAVVPGDLLAPTGRSPLRHDVGSFRARSAALRPLGQDRHRHGRRQRPGTSDGRGARRVWCEPRPLRARRWSDASRLRRSSDRSACRCSPWRATCAIRPRSRPSSTWRWQSSAESTSSSTTPEPPGVPHRRTCRSQAWQKVIDVNLTGPFLFSQSAGKVMIPQGRGKIINISSMAAFKGAPQEALNAIPYNASKGGLISFTRDLAVKWARFGINVNAIAPGWFPSDMSQKVLDDVGRRAAGAHSASALWRRRRPEGRGRVPRLRRLRLRHRNHAPGRRWPARRLIRSRPHGRRCKNALLAPSSAPDIVETSSEARDLAQPPLLILDSVRAFMDEHGLGAGELRARVVGEGRSNFTFLIERDEGRFVLRRPPRPPYPRSAHDVAREARLQLALSPLGIRVADGPRRLRERPRAGGAVLRHGLHRG